MTYAVADVTSPLDSVAQMCDQGATVVFTRTGGYVASPKGKVLFERRGDSYIRKTWIHRPRKQQAPAVNTEAAKPPRTPDSAAMEVDLLTRPTYAEVLKCGTKRFSGVPF